MENYYLIPICEDSFYLNDKSLSSILYSSYPELVQKEEERISILYSVSPIYPMPKYVKKRYEQHKIKTRKLYDELQMPYYLIAYGNDMCTKEILTKSKITTEYSAQLGIRRVSKEEVEKYYSSINYEVRIYNYFNSINNICESSLALTDFYEIEGYIEGKMDKQDIKGNFNGKIKFKKLEFKHK